MAVLGESLRVCCRCSGKYVLRGGTRGVDWGLILWLRGVPLSLPWIGRACALGARGFCGIFWHVLRAFGGVVVLSGGAGCWRACGWLSAMNKKTVAKPDFGVATVWGAVVWFSSFLEGCLGGW